jgi:hypothetical protein
MSFFWAFGVFFDINMFVGVIVMTMLMFCFCRTRRFNKFD